jgi:hypothetical protein
MPVRLEDISIGRWGPISGFSFQPAGLNLLYGRNETGKTALVEFLIRSLFRKSKVWPVRPFEGKGRVRVTGLTEKPVDFSPSSVRKLDHYLETDWTGLPPDFCRLLVVKGAEVELTGNPEGVDRTILTSYLSRQDVLDRIEKGISKTLQGAEILNGRSVGPKMGELSDLEKMSNNLKILDGFFDKIDRDYSGGRRAFLAQQKKNLEERLESMEQSKRHRAFLLASEIREFQKKKGAIPADRLHEIKKKITEWEIGKRDAVKKEKDWERAREASRHHEWLKNARTVAVESLDRPVVTMNRWFLVLSLVLLILASVFSILAMPWGALAALAGLGVVGFFWVRTVHAKAADRSRDEEWKRLKDEFHRRFGKELTGLPQLTMFFEKIADEYGRFQVLDGQRAGDLDQLERLEQTLSDEVFDLCGERFAPVRWSEAVRQIEQEAGRIQSLINEKQVELAGLHVDPKNYRPDPQDLDYSEGQEQDLRKRLEDVGNILKDELAKLDSLKHEICAAIGDPNLMRAPWETVIEKLVEKRNGMIESVRDLSADILGKIVVHQILGEFRKDETGRIVEGLKSPQVSEPLRRITRRYNELDWDGERILVRGPDEEYALSDLSTGAREQILLCLRMGLGAKLLNQDRMFLILDDAFQYSDWKRREALVEGTVDLVRQGWQIFYLTMDDHLKQLFAKKGKALGPLFRMRDMDEENAVPQARFDL